MANKINQKLEEVNKLIDDEKKEREELENSCVKNREEILNKLKNEFNNVKKQREEFEENFFLAIEESCTKLANTN